MPKIITEDMIEQAAIKALHERHDYIVLNCMTEEPDTLPDGTGRKDKKQVVLPDVMFESLCRINPDIPEQTVHTVVDELCHTPVSGDLMLTNYQNYQKIRNGITVEYNKNGKKTSNILRLLAYNDALSNTFSVASQMWIKGETHWRRPDLIIFINGFPMVFIELKNSNIPVKNAYDINLKNYLKDIPYLFNYNQICVLSNGMETRLGSFAAGYEFFFEWLKVENEKENPDRKAIREYCTSLEYFIAGLCEPNNLLDYIENFILYDRRRTKIIAKNHQFFGVNNAYDAFLRRDELKGKLGVFWHTQGSGKSYSMVMLARKIKHKCTGNFTFLIVTDREDLDTQIYKNFLRTEFITDKDKVQPANSKQLREELKTNKSILFTLIHKFRYDKGKKYPVLSERDDIIVIVDEAHRTQYKDLAENMRTGLPNAQFLAFTGTPLLGAKRLTNAWFGDYVSEYNFAESIKDNATVPLYYVKRVPEVELQNDFLDSDFAEILEEENLTDAEQRRLENHYAKELEVIKRDDRLDAIDETLEKLGLDYLDQMIIHSPQPWNEFRVEKRYYEENKEVWRALEDAQAAGKVKVIGVSNFLKDDLENLLSSCRVKPMVNQILLHISNTDLALVNFCKTQGIQVEAYSPIAHGEALNNPAIVEMAKKYGVSAAQLCIRYVLQLGAVALPKTANPTHMASNADVNFTISEEDMEALKNMEHIADYGEFNAFPVFSGKPLA